MTIDLDALRAIHETHSPSITEDGFDQVCATCEQDWPCERWDETFTPGTIGELLAENDRLRRQLTLLLPVANEALKPTGEHRIIDGYCPDCGGQCLRTWLPEASFHPYTCGRCRASLGLMSPEFSTAEGYRQHVAQFHPEGDIA